MLISKSEYPVTEAGLSHYEAAHGFTFPQEYRAFLLKYNGGETPETDFRLSGVSSDLVSFYELRDGGDGLALYEGSGPELYEMEFLVPDFLKDGMFPIAENVFGDHMFLCVDGRERGKIFFRYHDRPKRYIKLADSFRTFVQKCKSKKLGHCRTIEERIQGRIDAGITLEVLPIEIADWQAEIDHYNRIHQEQVEL